MEFVVVAVAAAAAAVEVEFELLTEVTGVTSGEAYLDLESLVMVTFVEGVHVVKSLIMFKT